MLAVHDVLHAERPRSSRASYIRSFTASLIVLNVVLVMLESVETIERSMGRLFQIVDMISVGVFSLEYLLRLWSSPVSHPEHSRARARLRYAFTFFGLVDLLAIAPFYLQAFFIADLRVVRGLRLLRLERLLLLGRHSKGLRLLGRAVQRTKSELYASFAVTGMVLLISATIVYYLEHDTQPEKFSSIPESLWWGIITLTSVGYGDIFPVTSLGKLFGGIISLLGVGLAALPSGLIASGFVQEFKDEAEAREAAKGGGCCQACGQRLPIGSQPTLPVDRDAPALAAAHNQ
jgi:voltage-gated potassium channel